MRGGAEDVSRDPADDEKAAGAGISRAQSRVQRHAGLVTPRKIANDEITELSGIVSSHRTNGVSWVNNDSGDRRAAVRGRS